MGQPAETLTDRLIAHFGGKKETADALGVHPETVRLWGRDGIPLKSALDVERKSGGVVTAEEVLREAKREARV